MNFLLWLWMAVMTLAASGVAAPQPQKQLLAPDPYPSDPSLYVGADTCKTCHEDIGKSFDKSPHYRSTQDQSRGPRWQGCEACHGPGKEHAEAGDPANITRFVSLSREDSSRRCLQCHKFDKAQGASLLVRHLNSNVGCSDCHSTHTPKVKPMLLKAPPPQLCASCHVGGKPDLSKRFHDR